VHICNSLAAKNLIMAASYFGVGRPVSQKRDAVGP
jgi:hypothetical protein